MSTDPAEIPQPAAEDTSAGEPDTAEAVATPQPADETPSSDAAPTLPTSTETTSTDAAAPDTAVEADAPDGELIPITGDDAKGSPEPIDVAALEALLFATHHPLTAGRLAELMDLPSTKPIRQAITALNADYEATGRSFRIEQVAGGYQLLTLPQYGERLKRLVQKENDAKLTKAAMETLAIIAYKQPILRVDVEAIRGVACGEAIRGLMEKHLVKIAGRAEEPGRPILYGTTKRFLEVFGLNAINDLPTPEQAAKRISESAAAEG